MCEYNDAAERYHLRALRAIDHSPQNRSSDRYTAMIKRITAAAAMPSHRSRHLRDALVDVLHVKLNRRTHRPWSDTDMHMFSSQTATMACSDKYTSLLPIIYLASRLLHLGEHLLHLLFYQLTYWNSRTVQGMDRVTETVGERCTYLSIKLDTGIFQLCHQLPRQLIHDV
jgi:hypothetical protein